MYAKVIFDNKAKRGLGSGWGFSCLLDGKILFDTGPEAGMLTGNMDRLMVDAGKICSVVISHDHWDHTGGLWEILRLNKGVKVYACRPFSQEFKNGVKELGGKLCFADDPVEISKNIFVTGCLECEYKGELLSEQALVIKGQKGVSVVTGCAHPGILRMVAEVKESMGVRKIYMVFGGFHLEKTDREGINSVIDGLKKMGVSKVGPSHCSGDKARRVFKGKFHENYIPVKAGHIIQL
jgi:7,8-dihydropterin-6-yl-methyl-4-(beta-D-ribofuranosyl)aminobenzene 5'-phosphate synthase